MARKAFYSFHYVPDNWRASQVRNIGVVDGNRPVSDNDWETIKKDGDAAIKKWIADQMYGKSCTIVLVGEQTAGRKWINHEIIESWNARMGVLGICIHNLKNSAGNNSSKGKNPFDSIDYGTKKLSSVVNLYDPPYSNSTDVYDYIKRNLEGWVEAAITIRGNN